MSDVLTIYECPNCGAISIDPEVVCNVTHDSAVAVRVFRESAVRELFEACTDDSGHSIAPESFPAPDEWREGMG
jgi:hypothetical protein